MIAVAEAAASKANRMDAKVSHPVLPFHRHRRGSPYVRLAAELGYAKEKTARDNVARPYLQVAITNRVLIEAGLTEKVGELMACVDASMMGEDVPHWTECQYLHDKSDATEDQAQAEWIHNTSTDALKGYIGKLRSDLWNAERLLTALVRELDRREGEDK